MNVTISPIQGNRQVTVLQLQGRLDAAAYRYLIATARTLYDMGTRHIILDLSGTSHISCSGLVALHSIAVALQGNAPPDLDAGWNAIHAVEEDLARGSQTHLKLLNVPPQVDRLLARSGFKHYVQTYADLDAAVASC